MKALCQNRRNRGTVLMECVLVLPILTLLIFAIVQFALIWYAQIMTHYAAYNAARAALVYHPGEYTEKNAKGEVVFSAKRGVCWEAACQSLAWVSFSGDGYGPRVPGWWKESGGRIPYSADVARQVTIVEDECEEVYRNAPIVKVAVGFDFPLHVPVVGKMIAYFSHVGDSNPSEWGLLGWMPTSEGIAALDEVNRRRALGYDYITLTGTVLLPKLWSTHRFGRRPVAVAQDGGGQ